MGNSNELDSALERLDEALQELANHCVEDSYSAYDAEVLIDAVESTLGAVLSLLNYDTERTLTSFDVVVREGLAKSTLLNDVSELLELSSEGGYDAPPEEYVRDEANRYLASIVANLEDVTSALHSEADDLTADSSDTPKD